MRAILTLIAAVICAIGPPALATAGAQNRTAKSAFPRELVAWEPNPGNPVFTAKTAGPWAVKIRERGWILREGDCYHLWFTGYDGTHEGIKQLGYATSPDGLKWRPSAKNPLCGKHWIEDMMVVREGGMYCMFAEGAEDNHAVMLTSNDRVTWRWEGPLEVRAANGKQSAKRPCGTPTVFSANGRWYLVYEWLDRGAWLAKTNNLRSRVWTNVRDEPVLRPGPADYDKKMIAVDQVIKHRGAYFAFYHGTSDGSTWNTNVARSADLVHWEKYAGNPLVDDNKSSGIVVPVGRGFRLYTMHDRVDVFEPREE